MALIKCTECGRDISDAAVACPGCGYPLKPNTESSRAPAVTPQSETAKHTSDRRLPPTSPPPKRGYVWLVVLLGLLGTCWYIGVQSTPSYRGSNRGSVTYSTYPKSSDQGSSEWKSYQKSTHPVDMLLKRCSAEAGISGPEHLITTEEMRRFTSCIDRNM